jgi:hypothetical protein
MAMMAITTNNSMSVKPRPRRKRWRRDITPPEKKEVGEEDSDTCVESAGDISLERACTRRTNTGLEVEWQRRRRPLRHWADKTQLFFSAYRLAIPFYERMKGLSREK